MASTPVRGFSKPMIFPPWAYPAAVLNQTTSVIDVGAATPVVETVLTQDELLASPMALSGTSVTSAPSAWNQSKLAGLPLGWNEPVRPFPDESAAVCTTWPFSSNR